MKHSLSALGRFLSQAHPRFTLFGWGMTTAILALSVIPASERPVTGAGSSLEHLAAFSLAGGLFAVGHAVSATRLAMCAVIGCGLIEVLQFFEPTRHARMSDLILNTTASLSAILIVASLRGITRHAGGERP